jgi:hypothetical protein
VRQQVINIVPHLPPQTSGVGDYAANIGKRMQELGDAVCGYVAAGHLPVNLPLDGGCVRNISGKCRAVDLWRAVEELAEATEPSPNPARLTSTLSSDEASSPQAALKASGSIAVVLHYSGYGYEQNGAPRWLVDALRNRPPGIARVVTYFHELYANGRPWQRAFWYSARQRHVAVEIANLSDALLTNRQQSARWLEDMTGRAANSVASFPVTSNVGEPDDLPLIPDRPARAVTFGNPGWKRFALYDDAPLVSALLRRLGIVEFVDIGNRSPIDRTVFAQAGIMVTERGFLPATEVTRELRACRLGFVQYPVHGVAKSSIFAAYGAHGVVPVLRDGRGLSADGVRTGEHMLAIRQCQSSTIEESDLERISAAIRSWYQTHSSSVHARAILALATMSSSCKQHKTVSMGAVAR